MTDRTQQPSSRPNTNPPPQSLNGATNPSFPATKPQLYGANRPIYRPPTKPRRYRRSCCCACFLWTSLLLIALILLAAIFGAVLWVLYRPQRPSFSVSALRITQLKITTTTKSSSSHLNSTLDLTVSARNPNKKLVFLYDPLTVSVSSNGVDVGDGSFPSFVHGAKNTTVLRSSITSKGRDLDSASASSLNSDLKKMSGGLDLEIQLETKVKLKMGGFKTKKVGIKISCDGIKAVVQKGKTPSPLSPSSDSKCKVDLRIKIWKWTF